MRNSKLPLITIITLIAALLRFYNLMWGDGFFFHPDERNIATAVSQLCFQLPATSNQQPTTCSLNPHFFAYGAFPLYLAYFSHQTISFVNQFFKAVYFNLFDKWPLISLTKIAKISFTDSIFYLRFWSALASTFTVPLVYLITKELFTKKKAPITRGSFGVGKGFHPLPTDTRNSFTSQIKQFVKSSIGIGGERGTCTRNVQLRAGWFTHLAYGPFSAGASSILTSISSIVNHPPLVTAILTAFTPGLIQAAHFGTTESLLTFFFMLILYLSLKLFCHQKTPPSEVLGDSSLVRTILASHPSPNYSRPTLSMLSTIKSSVNKYLFLLSLALGLALATKLTAIYFLVPPILALFLRNFLAKNLLSRKPKQAKKLLELHTWKFIIIFLTAGFLTFILVSPYNFLSFGEFLRISLYETKVAAGEIHTFYTQQFINTTPLLFQIRYIFPYALGWPIFILGSLGFFLLIKRVSRRAMPRVPQKGELKIFPVKLSKVVLRLVKIFTKRVSLNSQEHSQEFTSDPFLRVPRQHNRRRTEWFLLLSFLVYFLPNTFLFTKWTRFMTPIFPFFAIFAAYFLHLIHQKTALRRILVHLSSLLKDWTLNLVFFISHLFNFVKSPNLGKKWGVEMPGVAPGRFGLRVQSSKLAIPTPVFITTTLLLLLSILPGLFFFQIYTKEDVRLQASQWIHENIPDKAYILSETGNVVDIPLTVDDRKSSKSFTTISFDFYHLDENPALLEELVNHLERADYILVPSRRIFANHLRLPKKYPITSHYYQALFDGRLGFELIHVQTYKGSEQPADAEAFFKRAAARWRDESLTGNGKFASFSSQLLKKVRQIFPKRVREIFKVNQRSARATLASDSRVSLSGGERTLLLADEAAEETWTVFDHPVVRIFKKVTPYDKLYYQTLLKTFSEPVERHLF